MTEFGGILPLIVNPAPNLNTEEAVSNALKKFHQEQQGVAPRQIQAHLLPDMVVVVSSGVYSPSEQQLSDTSEGKKLIQSARRDLRALTRRAAETAVSNIVGRHVLRSFFDIDTRTGDQVEVYILERQIDP